MHDQIESYMTSGQASFEVSFLVSISNSWLGINSDSNVGICMTLRSEYICIDTE